MKLVHIFFLGLIFSTHSFAQEYQVSSCIDLQSIGKGENYPGASHSDAWPLDGSYYLSNDIDCMGTEFDQVAPVAESPFYGSLEGNGFTISNVTGGKGIFGYVSYYESMEGLIIPSIRNLKLSNFDINATRNFVGALIDYAQVVRLRDIEVTGSTIINAGEYTGVIGGYVSVEGIPTNDIVVQNSSVSGINYTGGAFGRSEGFTNYVYTRNLEVNGKNYVGGISGSHDASDYIGHLSSRGSNISGVDYVGGIFGQFGENIADGMNIAASDQNTIIGSSYVGGLFGKSSSFSNSQAYSTSDIVSTDGDYVGGLYGELDYANNAHVYFSGSLSVASTAQNVGRILGNTTEDVTLSNAFYYDEQEWLSPVDKNYGEASATYENFATQSWYLDSLGFASSNWTFYNPLDVRHGPWMIK